MDGSSLMDDWELTKYLLHNMWNYTDVSEVFSMAFRDMAVFEVLQDLLRDQTLRSNINTDEVNNYSCLVTWVLNVFMCL